MKFVRVRTEDSTIHYHVIYNGALIGAVTKVTLATREQNFVPEEALISTWG